MLVVGDENECCIKQESIRRVMTISRESRKSQLLLRFTVTEWPYSGHQKDTWRAKPPLYEENEEMIAMGKQKITPCTDPPTVLACVVAISQARVL